MDIKFNCSNPACGQRIAAEVSQAGRSILCPACGQPSRVPESSNFKFNCPHPDCGQHIVVDSHRKITRRLMPSSRDLSGPTTDAKRTDQICKGWPVAKRN
jgi:predicted RNA-binding Zn-ribbon protein involved in translation (DUF1610 family)